MLPCISSAKEYMLGIDSTFEQLLYTTVRIEAKNKDGVPSVGTGFIFGYSKDNMTYYFLVTNRHVIENSTEGLLRLHYGDGKNPVLGKFKDVRISNFEGQWIKHPKEDIDIAIMPFLPVWEGILKEGEQIFFKCIGLNQIPSDEIIKNEIDAVEDIVFIGYPNDVYDKKNFLPVVRKGITATPISVDFEGRPVFLIDASVFGGSSGSPVFICNVGSYSQKGKGLIAGTRLFFVGIVADVYYREDFNKIEVIEIPTKKIPMSKTRQMVDIGVVYKSSVIVQFIEDFLNIKK